MIELRGRDLVFFGLQSRGDTGMPILMRWRTLRSCVNSFAADCIPVPRMDDRTNPRTNPNWKIGPHKIYQTITLDKEESHDCSSVKG